MVLVPGLRPLSSKDKAGFYSQSAKVLTTDLLSVMFGGVLVTADTIIAHAHHR